MVGQADAVIACSDYMRGHIASAFKVPARTLVLTMPST